MAASFSASPGFGPKAARHSSRSAWAAVNVPENFEIGEGTTPPGGSGVHGGGGGGTTTGGGVSGTGPGVCIDVGSGMGGGGAATGAAAAGAVAAGGAGLATGRFFFGRHFLAIFFAARR